MWDIEYWESGQDNQPIYDFIESLPYRAQAKVANTFDLLASYGIHLGSPHVKKVRNQNFWELRILGTNNIRFFYVAIIDKKFLILHGFVKKSNKIPIKEIKLAKQRLMEYQN